MQRRDYFKDLIKKDPHTKLPNCEGKSVDDEPYIALEFYSRQARLTQAFLNFNAEKGIQWLFGYANYINQNYVVGSTNNFLFRRKYPTGSLIMVDFFGGFGNELIFDHPAIVLKDLRHGLIVAPLTSTPDVYSKAPSNPLDIQLQKNDRNSGFLRKNSTIRLAQIRYISKKRILSLMTRTNAKGHSTDQRVKGKDKLQEIEVALCNLFGNDIFNKVLKTEVALEARTNALKEERTSLKQDQEALILDQEAFALERETFELEKESFELEKQRFLKEKEEFERRIQKKD